MKKKNNFLKLRNLFFVFLFFLIGGVFYGCLIKASAEKSMPQDKKMPKITWDTEKLYVNGKPYFIRGINYVGDSLKGGIKATPLEKVRRDVEMLKDLNVNTVRLWDSPSHEILDIFYENGIMVIMQISDYISYPGSWTDFRSKEQLKSYSKTAREQVRRDKDHPVILMWCIWNDGPFGLEIVRKYSQKVIEDWLGEFAKAIKEEDPSRPITSANMDVSGCYDLGADFLDILGFNNYGGTIADGGYAHSATLRTYDTLVDIGYKYNKPIIITEAGKHTLIKPELQGKAIKSLVDAARTRTAGICIFMFADQWSKAGKPDVQDRNPEDHWGIVDRYRNPKSGYLALKDAYAKIKEDGPEKADIKPYITPSVPFPTLIKDHKLIEDFEIDDSVLDSKLKNIYTGESTLKVSISDEKSWTGEKSLKMVYKAKTINTWGCAILKLNSPIPADAKGLALWIYRDGSFNSLRMQIEDADRDNWIDHSIQLGEPGWVYYIIDFDKLEREPHGSPSDSNGVFDKGTVEKIIFVFGTIASPKASTIYIDSIEMLY